MPYDPRFVFRQSLTGSRALLDFGGIRFSFAFRLVEDWFHASASRLRRAGFCATHKRSRALPGVPTLDEEGMADFDTSLWFGLLGPPGTPRPIINKLADAAPKAMQTPKAQEALRKQGFETRQRWSGRVCRVYSPRKRSLV